MGFLYRQVSALSRPQVGRYGEERSPAGLSRTSSVGPAGDPLLAPCAYPSPGCRRGARPIPPHSTGAGGGIAAEVRAERHWGLCRPEARRWRSSLGCHKLGMARWIRICPLTVWRWLP